MAAVMLVQPWNFHDEGVAEFDPAHEWRNGPYNILLLATILNRNGHQAMVVDLARDIVSAKGNADACLARVNAGVKLHHSPE